MLQRKALASPAEIFRELPTQVIDAARSYLFVGAVLHPLEFVGCPKAPSAHATVTAFVTLRVTLTLSMTINLTVYVPPAGANEAFVVGPTTV